MVVGDNINKTVIGSEYQNMVLFIIQKQTKSTTDIINIKKLDCNYWW